MASLKGINTSYRSGHRMGGADICKAPRRSVGSVANIASVYLIALSTHGSLSEKARTVKLIKRLLPEPAAESKTGAGKVLGNKLCNSRNKKVDPDDLNRFRRLAGSTCLQGRRLVVSGGALHQSSTRARTALLWITRVGNHHLPRNSARGALSTLTCLCC